MLVGFTGSRVIMARWVAKKRRTLPPRISEPVPRKITPWPPSRAAWLFIKDTEKLAAADKAALGRIEEASEDAALAYSLGQQFVKMVREQRAELLDPWIVSVLDCGLSSLIRFAQGVRQDFDAVLAALSLPWSSGQTEGQINRLKLIKRSMYGRANFDLLRKRVLGMAS